MIKLYDAREILKHRELMLLSENSVTKETKRVCAKINATIVELEARINVKKSFGKADMRTAVDALMLMRRRLRDNDWRINAAYKEQMEKLTDEAKTEADAYIHNAVLELGERTLAKAIVAGDITQEQVKSALSGASHIKMLPPSKRVNKK